MLLLPSVEGSGWHARRAATGRASSATDPRATHSEGVRRLPAFVRRRDSHAMHSSSHTKHGGGVVGKQAGSRGSMACAPGTTLAAMLAAKTFAAAAAPSKSPWTQTANVLDLTPRSAAPAGRFQTTEMGTPSRTRMEQPASTWGRAPMSCRRGWAASASVEGSGW